MFVYVKETDRQIWETVERGTILSKNKLDLANSKSIGALIIVSY